MRLRTKVYLGIILVFGLLAVVVSLITVRFVNNTVVGYSAKRVNLNINSAWLIYNNRLDVIRKVAQFLAEQEEDTSPATLAVQQARLETFRKKNGLDVLLLISPERKVLLRTNAPYATGDTITGDPLVEKALHSGMLASGTILLPEARLKSSGGYLLDRCLKNGGEPMGMFMGAAVPIISRGRVVAILELGTLLNGATEKVDQIRDLVFENKLYEGKPEGTATLFMNDLRISTNVVDARGRRAIGTRVSRQVANQVLRNGVPWNGRALVVDTWYLSQYDPIKDPNGKIIGMLYVGDLEQKYLDMRTHQVAVYLGVVLLGMTLALVVFLWISKELLDSIRSISHATRKLADGDLGHRVSTYPKSEVGELAESFDRMAEQLEKQRAEIEADHAQVEAMNEELRQTNKNYMELLGFVSHELKNPLASAILSLYTVKDGYLGELTDTQLRALESVGQSLDYFQDMIKNYLDLSRAEKGEIEVHLTNVALQREVVSPVVNGLDQSLREKSIVLQNLVAPSLVINTDRDLIRIVFDNLLSNAVKYGKEGGVIRVDAETTGRDILFSVFNEGAGIPADKLSLLFRKFGRINDPSYVGKRGTGLGLFLCKQIVEKLGGTICAESEEGQWVQFNCVLPGVVVEETT